MLNRESQHIGGPVSLHEALVVRSDLLLTDKEQGDLGVDGELLFT